MRSERLLLAAVLLAGCSDPAPASPAPPAPVDETCPGVGIGKGPFSLHVDRTSARVRWEACRADVSGELTLTPEAGGESRVVVSTQSAFEITEERNAPLDPSAPHDLPGTYYMHEAALDGLAPGACHRYALSADASLEGRVCAAKPEGQPLRFMAIGDTNPGLNGITEKLLGHVLPKNPDFILHAGDVQYYDSFLETWASWFPKMRPMLAQGAFLPAVGNHESEKPEELDAYFARFFGGAGFDGPGSYYRFESGGVWFFALDTEESLTLGSDQAVWLEKQLIDAAGRPGFRFSIVYFHKPFVTCGDTAQDTTARALLEPVFLANGVKLVVQAHMHGYERFELGGLTYVTTGGGGGALDNVDAHIDRAECASRVASGAFRHAVVFDVKTAELSAQVIDDEGATRDTFTMTVP